MSEDDAGDNVLYMCHWRPFLWNAPGPPAVAGTEDLQIVVALAFMSVLHQNWMHTSPQRPLGNQKMLTPHCREAEETSAQGYSAQVSAPCTQPARTALGNEPARGFLLLHSQRPLPKDTSVWWRRQIADWSYYRREKIWWNHLDRNQINRNKKWGGIIKNRINRKGETHKTNLSRNSEIRSLGEAMMTGIWTQDPHGRNQVKEKL